jgi:hypothetical protein
MRFTSDLRVILRVRLMLGVLGLLVFYWKKRLLMGIFVTSFLNLRVIVQSRRIPFRVFFSLFFFVFSAETRRNKRQETRRDSDKQEEARRQETRIGKREKKREKEFKS